MHASFGAADTNRVGAGGELRTAELLNEIADLPDGPTVMHDLQVPGSRANIDHVVVSGSRVHLIDTKVWRPGFYCTIAGGTWRTGGRGVLERFEPGDKRTLPLAAHRLEEMFARAGVHARVQRSTIVVWPSSVGKASPKLRLWAYRPAGARAVVGDRMRGALRYARRPAHPKVVAALLPYVIGAR
ncbi:MAG: nuclease-related domain-containing protein [Curtobacterium sp.]